MNELIFNNQDLGLKIRAIKNEDGSISINAEDTAIGFGWTKTETKGNKKYTTIRWKRMNDFLNELGFRPQVGEGDYIPESVFYLLGMKAQNETAVKFQNWLALEVIPSIRKTGSYNVNQPQYKLPATYKEALLQLVEAEEEKERLQLENKQKDQIIGELKPKADYTDVILKSKSLVTITQIAKDYGMSGQEMNSLLHELKVQYKLSDQWLLYSKYHNEGYTHSETIPIKHKSGRLEPKMNTKWTQKGRLFLYDLLKENGILPVIEREEF